MSNECHGNPEHSAAPLQHLELRKSSLFSTESLPSTTIVYCVLIVFLILKYKRQQKEQQCSMLARILEKTKLKAMPTPPMMPIIGHLHLMRDYPENPWDGFNAIRREYGDIVSLKMGVHQMVLISSPKYMNEVLIKKGDIFADRPSFPRHDIVFGGDKEHSLALCNWSNTHRARRKFCKRGIVPNKLSARNELLEKVISEIMGEFIADIKNNDSEKRIKTKQQQHQKEEPFVQCDNQTSYTIGKRDLLFLTGDIFMKFLCNESRPHDDPAYESFNNGCDFIFYDINQCYLLDFMPYLTSFGFGYSYLRQLQGITDYCRFYIDDNIFEPRREMHLKRRQAHQDPVAGPPNSDALHQRSSVNKKPIEEDEEKTLSKGVNFNIGNPSDDNADDDDDYLDSIIKDHLNCISSMSLEDYKVGFADLLAGHAAVTNILMRLLGHLSLDEHTQELIYKETERTKLTSLKDQIPPLPVTEAALHEALRLASSPIVPHVAREDSSIGEYFVPKGSAVLFNCYNVNLSPELWHRLDDEGNEISSRQFWPRRFLNESKDSMGAISYKLELPKYFMPFSVGPRQCLGYKMVESISIAAAAYICSKYIIRPNKKELVERLLAPRGTVALSPLQECFSLHLIPR